MPEPCAANRYNHNLALPRLLTTSRRPRCLPLVLSFTAHAQRHFSYRSREKTTSPENHCLMLCAARFRHWKRWRAGLLMSPSPGTRSRVPICLSETRSKPDPPCFHALRASVAEIQEARPHEKPRPTRFLAWHLGGVRCGTKVLFAARNLGFIFFGEQFWGRAARAPVTRKSPG